MTLFKIQVFIQVHSIQREKSGMELFFKFRFLFRYIACKGRSQAWSSLKLRFVFRYIASKGGNWGCSHRPSQFYAMKYPLAVTHSFS